MEIANKIKVQIKAMWRAAPVATVLLGICLAADLFFGARTVIETLYWSDPTHHNQPIAGWMTPRYVAHSWRIPRASMIEIIQSAAPGVNTDERPGSLKDIAARNGIPLDLMIQQIAAEIDSFHAALPAPETAE